MGWVTSAHGDLSHLNPEVAAEAEQRLVDALRALYSELVPEGHQGVAATFQGEHSGTVNLLAAGEPTAGSERPEGAAVADGTPGEPPTEPPPAFDPSGAEVPNGGSGAPQAPEGPPAPS